MSHFTDFTGYVVFIITSFLAGVESADQCLLNSKVLSCFSGVIMSIRSSFLYTKKYKKKLLKCYELSDKITSSLVTFEVLISLILDDGTVIHAKEFHKLQTLYLHLMTHVRNIGRKMKVLTEENFQKTIMDEITNLRKALVQK